MPWRVYRWVAALITVGCLALIAAYHVRYSAVEPAAVGAFCEAVAADWRCQVRQAFLALLTDQRLGWLAIAVAAASLMFTAQWLGWIAWFVASAGFVLYNAELSSPALLLAGVALTRSRSRAPDRRRSEQRPAACKR